LPICEKKKKREEFQKVVAPGSTGPKLNEAAGLLVVSSIIEGLTNEEIYVMGG
jgi:hypothetical protein